MSILEIASGDVREAIGTIQIASVDAGPGPRRFRLGVVEAFWCAPAGDPVIYAPRGAVSDAALILGQRDSWRLVELDDEAMGLLGRLPAPMERVAAPAPIERFAWSILHVSNLNRGVEVRPPVGDPALVPIVHEDGSLEVVALAAEPATRWRYVVVEDGAAFDEVVRAIRANEVEGMVVMTAKGLQPRHRRMVTELRNRLLLA